MDIEFLSAMIPVFFYVFVFSPIIIYFSWKFYLQRNHIVIQKRYGIITLYEVAFGLIEIYLRTITIIIDYFCPNSYVSDTLEDIDSFFVALVTITWCIRFFHLFYGMFASLSLSLCNNKKFIN